MDDLQVSDKLNTDEPILTKNNVVLLSSALILGLVFDFLFYKKPFGISYPIFVMFLYGAFLFNLRKSMVLKLNFGAILTIPVLMLSMTYFLYSNNVFEVLNFLAIPILLIIQTVLISGNNTHEWYSFKFIEDFFYNSIYKTFANLFKPFVIITRLIKPKPGNGKYDVLKKVLMGLVISIPLIMIIVGLLASADQIFENYVDKIPKLFENLSIGEFVGQSIIVCIITLLSFGYLFGLKSKKTIKKNNVNQTSEIQNKVFDPVIMITILSLINVIYILFTIIQFSYLFGNLNYALPSNFTYSEYARRGFFELIFVTLINFVILLLSIGLTRKSGKASSIVIGVLHSLVVFCTFIMLISAHYRMSMYEEAYGYTYLRILTHSFMAFLFILFIITLYKIWNEKLLIFKPFIVVALVSYIIVNYMNIDVIITNKNLERYEKTGNIDVSYFNDLSYDCIYGLNYLATVKDEKIRTDAEQVLDSKKMSLKGSKSWQSFNLSEYKAKKVIK